MIFDNQEIPEKSQARFRIWAETTDAIMFIIQNKQISYINSLTETVTGYTKEELLAHSHLCQQLNSICCERGRKQCESVFPQYQELQIATKSGEQRWLDCSVGRFEYEGKPAKLVTAIDITSRKQAEIELRTTLEQERKLSQQRAHFVSMVSHEFRKPLHLISFCTSLLKRRNHQWNEEKKFQYFHHIQTAVEQLNQLMDKILSLGKAEAGEVTFKPRVLDLEQFCRNLVAELQQTGSSGHTITFGSFGDCSSAYVDEKLLQPILTNLVENAIKYSPDCNTVDLVLSCQDCKIIFQIKDRGIGIPAADRERLFESFYRSKNVGEIQGSGLGLAVVKRLVEVHDGKIFVESEVGVGTTFTITLSPTQPIEAPASTSQP